MDIKEIIKKSLRDESIYASLCYDLYYAINNNLINYDNADFCVLTPHSNIDKLVKTATLMPNTITFTHLNPVVSQIDHGTFWDPTINKDARKGVSEYEVLCHIPPDNFLTTCTELLSEGLIQYYPNTAYYITHPDGSTEFLKKNTVTNPKYVIDRPLATSSENKFNVALSLDIPYIYDVPLSEYSKTVLDNLDELSNFKKFFGKTIYNLDPQNKNEMIDFEYEINKNVNEIAQKYKSDLLKLKKSLILGTLETVLVSLFVFSDIEELFKCIIGISGSKGLLDCISSITDFRIEKSQLKGNDCYFLWIFKNK